jgi:hypothetical protein
MLPVRNVPIVSEAHHSISLFVLQEHGPSGPGFSRSRFAEHSLPREAGQTVLSSKLARNRGIDQEDAGKTAPQ